MCWSYKLLNLFSGVCKGFADVRQRMWCIFARRRSVWLISRVTSAQPNGKYSTSRCLFLIGNIYLVIWDGVLVKGRQMPCYLIPHDFKGRQHFTQLRLASRFIRVNSNIRIMPALHYTKDIVEAGGSRLQGPSRYLFPAPHKKSSSFREQY